MRQEHKWSVSLAALLLVACGNSPEANSPDPEASQGIEQPQFTEDVDSDTADQDDNDAGGLPETDIFIADITWTDGLPSVDGVRALTATGLYDNQPAFDAAGGFYFTSETPGSQTDIRYMNIATGEVSIVTDTPEESEYSPRPSPDGRSVTYIHQAPGDVGGQVWRQSLENSMTGPVHEYGPAGYYALAGDQSQMLLFALTDPFTLRWATFDLGHVTEVSEGIGRALYTSPDGASAYFTLEQPEGGWQVHQFQFADQSITPLFQLPGTSEDYAVFETPGGELAWFSVSDGTLHYQIGLAGWQPVADLNEAGLNGITRLAVSPEADRLAIVAEE
jgi:WD40-like Beta Propeller Repeat